MSNALKRATVVFSTATAALLTGCGAMPPGQNPLGSFQSAARTAAAGILPSVAPGAAAATHQYPDNTQRDSRGVLYTPTEPPQLIASANPQACMQMTAVQRRQVFTQYQAAAADRQNANRAIGVVSNTGRRVGSQVEYGVRSGNLSGAARNAGAAATNGAIQLGTEIIAGSMRNQAVENMQDRAAAETAVLAQDCRQAAAQACATSSNPSCFNIMTTTGRAPRF